MFTKGALIISSSLPRHAMITGPNPIFQYFVNTRPVESVFDQWYSYVDAEINSVSLARFPKKPLFCVLMAKIVVSFFFLISNYLSQDQALFHPKIIKKKSRQSGPNVGSNFLALLFKITLLVWVSIDLFNRYPRDAS